MDNDPRQDDLPAEPGVETKASRRESAVLARRKLLKAGAGAAPVLLALRSGPVSAGQGCVVASSFVSAATFASRNPTTSYIKCSNKNAGHWCSAAQTDCGVNQASWPAWAQVLVKNHLGCSVGNATYDNATIGSIMKQGLQASGRVCILQHILGLTLTMDYDSANITLTTTGGATMSKPYLASVWQKYYPTMTFQDAAAGVNWNETQLLSWLKKLQYDLPANT